MLASAKNDQALDIVTTLGQLSANLYQKRALALCVGANPLDEASRDIAGGQVPVVGAGSGAARKVASTVESCPHKVDSVLENVPEPVDDHNNTTIELSASNKYASKTFCDYSVADFVNVIGKRLSANWALNKAAKTRVVPTRKDCLLAHCPASTSSDSGKMAALHKLADMTLQHAITATPEQAQAAGQPMSPVTQATQASVVGPGNTPNANPIGSFGPLAANPGQITGNAALGVKNNVMKIGSFAPCASGAKQAVVTKNSAAEKLSALVSKPTSTWPEMDAAIAELLDPIFAKKAGTKFKTNTSYDPICPHCDKVMYEKHFVPDREQSGMWRHRGDCYDKGAFKITWPDQAERDASTAKTLASWGLSEKKALGDELAFKAWLATGLSPEEADRKAGESLALPTPPIRTKDKNGVPCEPGEGKTRDSYGRPCEPNGTWSKKAAAHGVDGEGGYYAHTGERCQHCFALHERGDDGNCNSCGKWYDHPAYKSAEDKDPMMPSVDVPRVRPYIIQKELDALSKTKKPKGLISNIEKSALIGPAVMPQRRKRKAVTDNSLPSWMLGTGALGAAGLGGAYAMAGDEQAANLGRIVSQHEMPLAPHETATTRYQSLMSEGAGVAPFGIPAGEIISRVRSQPRLMAAAGVQGYNADRPGSFQEARMHYDAFRKGPIAAYQHQLSAKGVDTKVAPELSLTHGVKTYDELMQPHFTSAFRKWRAGQQGQGQLLEGASGWLEPHEIDPQTVPLEAQRDFIRQYHEGLPPTLQAERQRVETDTWGPGLKNNEKNYRPVIEEGLKARNTMQTVGMTAGGAAAGGVLGHYLHRAMTGGREKDKYNPGYWAATGLGAGLGGAAGYFGGTPQGREAIARLLAKKAGLSDIVNHSATPFVVRPVIGAAASVGVNELVRRLTDAYVGKPSTEQQIKRARLVAAGMGAGMGLVGAGMPHAEAALLGK